MKKFKKGVIIILEILVILVLVSLISSKYLTYFEKKPLFILKTTTYDYYDGKVTEYLSLLHKVIKYDRDSMKKWEVTSLFKEHDDGKNNFSIIYDDEVCKDVGEEIYKDDKYHYILPCHSSSTIKIRFESNEEITLKDAIESKKVTIDELIKKRLLVEKVPITNN